MPKTASAHRYIPAYDYRLCNSGWAHLTESRDGSLCYTRKLPVFDLGALDYLSSAGLRVLLSAAKEVRRRDGKIVLCSLTEFVKEIFEVSGFESLIPIEDSVESGLKVLA